MTDEYKGLKILIVEDDDMLLTALEKQFSSVGFTVVTARDGNEGFEKFFSENPDAVVLDMMMPRKNGTEMLKEIHEKAPQDTTPCIILSNANDMDKVTSAVDSKATAYLVKSEWQLTDIVQMVAKQIKKK